MIGLETLLVAVIEAGVSLIVEVGMKDQATGLRDSLTKAKTTEKLRLMQAAYEDAKNSIQLENDDSDALLSHRPFQDEIIKGVLNGQLDTQETARIWGAKYPEYHRDIRVFFARFNANLVSDDVWGPIIQHYQQLQVQQEIRNALSTHKAPSTNAELVASISNLTADGSVVIGNNNTLIGANGVDIAILILRQAAQHEEAQLLKKYLAHISKTANLLPWSILDSGEIDLDNPRHPLGLKDVYIRPDTLETNAQTESQLRTDLEERTLRRISVQEILNRNDRLLLMGDPGSGKSTFAKYITFMLANARLSQDPDAWLKQMTPWEHGTLVPIPIELKDLGEFAKNLPGGTDYSHEIIEHYIRDMLTRMGLDKITGTILDLIRQDTKQIIFVFDGVDEVNEEMREPIITIINKFCRFYPAHRYLVTGRPYAIIGQTWTLKGFTRSVIAAFDENQIKEFISNWYRQIAERGFLSQQQADDKQKDLISEANKEQFRSLAERPLLLTIMAQVHIKKDLPDDRGTLYENAVDLLLERWERRLSQKGIVEKLDIPGLQIKVIKSALYEIAFKSHEASSNRGTADISEANLRAWIQVHLNNDWNKAGIFIDYIRERAGLLIRHKPNAYTFPHRTFQEFLAACYLFEDTEYVTKSADLVRQDYVKWKEVFILAAGKASKGYAISAINALFPKEYDYTPGQRASARELQLATLAGEALKEINVYRVESIDLGKAALARIRKWLEHAMEEQVEVEQRINSGHILAALKDSRFSEQYYYLPRPDTHLGFVKIPDGNFKMGDANELRVISIPEYWIGKYPVTVMQYRLFLEATGDPLRDENGNYERTWKDLNKQENSPVVAVSWDNARKYCAWLDGNLKRIAREKFSNIQPGQPGYEFWGLLTPENTPWRITLPNEAQWEKAARGSDGRKFPWGAEFNIQCANTQETGIGSVSPVGIFQNGKSPYGIMDMSGNVWEWTSSLYKPYPYISTDGRESANHLLGARVSRGGAYHYNQGDATCFRRNKSQTNWFKSTGFRIALSKPEQH